MARLQPKPAGRQKGSIDVLPSGALRVRVHAGQDPITNLGHNLALVAVARLGTSGAQALIHGVVATYYRTSVRSAGVWWCVGLGGVGGPPAGGLVVVSGRVLDSIFYVLAAPADVGGLLTRVVRRPIGRPCDGR